MTPQKSTNRGKQRNHILCGLTTPVPGDKHRNTHTPRLQAYVTNTQYIPERIF